MTTCLGKSCSFGLPRVPFVNYCQFMYLVISLLVLRAGCGIWLNRFLIIAYLFTLVYTIHLPTFHVCTKFQSSRPHSSWEKCDENFNVWKLETKKHEKIKGGIRAAAWFQYTRYIHPFSKCVTSFNLPGLTVPEKSVTKNFNVWKLERKKYEK